MSKMNNYCVYKITSPSNKIYIGVTNNFNRRMFEHKYCFLKNNYKWALHNSFKKYGFENHKKEIIYDNLSKKDAFDLENYLIIKYDTQNSKIGLNSRSGGMGGNIINWNSQYGDDLKKIIKDKRLKKYFQKWSDKHDLILNLINTKTIIEICNELNVSKTSLTNYMKLMNIKCPIKKRIDLDNIYLKYLSLKNQGFTDKEIFNTTEITHGTIYRIKQKLKKV